MATLHATEMVEIQKILNQMCRKKGFTVWDSLSILSNLIPRQQKNRILQNFTNIENEEYMAWHVGVL